MAVWSVSTLIDSVITRRIDSEFFKPSYLHAEQKIRRCNTEELGRLGGFISGPFGSEFHTKNYEFKSNYRYIRGRDVKPFFVLDDDNRYIPEDDFNRLQDYAIQPNDLMISVVGTLGNVAVCTPNETPAIFSCKSTLFRAREVNPYYLLAFLNCDLGQLCLLRRQRGAVQTGLNMEDLKTIPIPRFEDDVEEEIATSVHFAYNASRESKEKYTQAQRLIECELGLDSLNFEKLTGYLTRLSELEQARRIDPEHFLPEFQNLVANMPEHIQLTGLGAQLTFCQRGKQPVYSDQGLPVVNSKHVQSNRVVLDGNRTAVRNPSTEFHIRYGDTLINGTGRGTLGRAAPYLTDEQAIPDNHVTILRSQELDPAYLSFYLNSQAGQLQVEMHQRGSSGQLELYPFDIRKFLVWVAPESVQKEIRNLHDKATEREQRSRELLDQAKTSVERLIDEVTGG